MVITIIGRRWFEKTNGNTYHSVNVYVDGEQVHRIDCSYGYGGQYRHNAFQWLHKNGYFPEYEENHDQGSISYPATYWLEEHGYKVIDEVTDIQRKRDL